MAIAGRFSKFLEKGEKRHIRNVAGGNEQRDIEIASEVLRHLSLPETMMQFVADRPGHDFRYSLDCEKIHHLGWKPEAQFKDGLRRTIEWRMVNEWWWRRLLD